MVHSAAVSHLMASRTWARRNTLDSAPRTPRFWSKNEHPAPAAFIGNFSTLEIPRKFVSSKFVCNMSPTVRSAAVSHPMACRTWARRNTSDSAPRVAHFRLKNEHPAPAAFIGNFSTLEISRKICKTDNLHGFWRRERVLLVLNALSTFPALQFLSGWNTSCFSKSGA